MSRAVKRKRSRFRSTSAQSSQRRVVVLAVGVVVAALRAAELVAAEEHRRALRQQEQREEVSLLPGAQRVHLRARRRALLAAVPREVRGMAVGVALSVLPVVLVVVGDEIGEGEAVVARDEVHRVPRRPVLAVVEVGAAGEPRGEEPRHAGVALDEPAHVVPEVAVPLGPAAPAREAAHLVEAGGVPGLGDELHVGHHRVGRDRLEERRVRKHLAVAAAAEDRRQVEAEAVDVHLGHPVAQCGEDLEAQHRVVAVHRVAAAGVVEVPAGLRLEDVVGRVVEAPPAERGAALVALARVVEHHVEDDLDARFVERLHHLLELARGVRRRPVAGVRGLRREERHRLVAPEVAQRLSGEEVAPRHVALLELGHRHQLDRRDAQLAQVRDLLDDAAEGTRVSDARARVAREPAHVHLVDHRVGERDVERVLVAPVELLVDDARAQALEASLRGVDLAPDVEAGHRLPVRVDEELRAVEAEHVRRGVRLRRRPEGVLDARVDAFDEDVPDVAGLVVARVERQLEHRLALAGGEEDERDRRRVAREDREVHAVAPHGRPVRQGVAAAHRELAANDPEEPLSRGLGCLAHAAQDMRCRRRREGPGGGRRGARAGVSSGS